MLKKEAMAREREAVDSEFQICMTRDYRKFLQVFSTIVKPGHPVGKFGCGNKQTLSVVSEFFIMACTLAC